MDLTENHLNCFYESLAKEHQTILNNLKSSHEEEREKEKANYVQINLINQLMNNVLKLRNMRKKIANL